MHAHLRDWRGPTPAIYICTCVCTCPRRHNNEIHITRPGSTGPRATGLHIASWGKLHECIYAVSWGKLHECIYAVSWGKLHACMARVYILAMAGGDPCENPSIFLVYIPFLRGKPYRRGGGSENSVRETFSDKNLSETFLCACGSHSSITHRCRCIYIYI